MFAVSVGLSVDVAVGDLEDEMKDESMNSPIIEVGEHFCVVRGFQYRSAHAFSIFTCDDSKPPQDTKPEYDRSYNGIVFRALEVCGPMIVGEVAHSTSTYTPVGHRVPINTLELKVWPVTAKFLEEISREACGNGDGE